MSQFIKSKLIRLLGGFPSKMDAIDAVQEEDVEERRKILALAVRRLYNTITADDILKETSDGKWLLEGKQMSDDLKSRVIAEAEHFAGTKLWEVLQKDVKYQANRRMFLIGKSETDLIAGKLWTFTIDAFKTRLESLGKKRGTFNAKETG